ncbi:MAG: PIN domain-containing protein [Deltaproteobacteria bacterium]|nr:PIN domain-containing protein [Deltaproteobacteria bacterium]
MTLYLLDTNILIDLAGAKRSRPFFDGILGASPFRLATHILCVAEFYAGGKEREVKFLEEWVRQDGLEIIYLDSLQDAAKAGRLRKKNALTIADALILSSTARIRGHLLTHDADLLKKAKQLLEVSDPLQEDS